MALTTTLAYLAAILEKRIIATDDPIEKRRLIRELAELTKKETRG